MTRHQIDSTEASHWMAATPQKTIQPVVAAQSRRSLCDPAITRYARGSDSFSWAANLS